MTSIRIDETRELILRQLVSPEVLLVLLAVGVGYAVVLYRRERGLSRPRRFLLAGLRALVYASLITVLFQPVISRARALLVPSNVLVLVDSTASMTIADPRTSEEEIREAVAALAAKSVDGTPADGTPLDESVRAQAEGASRSRLVRGVLAGDALLFLRADTDERKVRLFRFGAELEAVDLDAIASADGVAAAFADETFTAKSTELGAALEGAIERHAGQEVDGVVVLTDGVSTGGIDPLAVARRFGERSIPVFPVGFGVSSVADVRVGSVIAQDTVFEKDSVPVRVEVSHSGLDGHEATVVLSLDGEELARKTVILDERRSQFVDFSFTPKSGGGTKKLAIDVQAPAGEISTANNRVERTVRVIDERIKVLYVEGKPRWEYRYLRAVLLRDPRLDVRFLLTEGDPDLARASPQFLARFPDRREDAARFDLVIFGDVPALFFTPDQLAWIERLVREDGGSFLLLAGQQHGLEAYSGTPVASVLPVKLATGWIDVHPAVHPALTSSGARSSMVGLGVSERQGEALWSLVRPLYRVPQLGGTKAGALTLMTLSDSTSGTASYPLVTWHRYGTGKALFVGTDQLWRLRYRQGDRHHARFWGQAIRFLTLSRLLGENRRVQIETGRREYRVGERVEIYVNALEESFEPTLAPSFALRATAEHLPGPVDLELRPVPGTPGLYHGVFSPGSPGRYALEASGSPDVSLPTSIDVTDFDRERLEPAMDSATLRGIAELSGGRALAISELATLESLLPSRAHEIVVRDEEDLWDNWILLTVLIACLGLEWLLRRKFDLV